MALVTLSMIVKNEEQYLEDCLKSAADAVDEIIIVDTGSTDRTIKIAKKYNAKIFSYEWTNDFSDARNFALSKSTGKWILYLDADERLQSTSKKELKRLASGNTNTAYYCVINNIDEINNRPCLMKYVRFFPNSIKHRFTGKVHEQIISSLLAAKVRIEESNIRIDHLGYGINEEMLKLKAERNLPLLLADYKNNKEGYAAYQIGQTYGMLGNKEKAIEYFLVSLSDKQLTKEYRATSARYIAGEYLEKGRLNESLEYIVNSLHDDNNQPITHLISSQIKFKLNDVKGMKESCIAAYNINNKLSAGKISSFQTIYLDSRTIIYHSLNYAILKGEREMFNYFFSELKQLEKYSGKGIDRTIVLIDYVINNKQMKEDEIIDFAASTAAENIELIITLAENYQYKEEKKKLFEEIYKRNRKNTVLINKYANILITDGRMDEAEEVLRAGISENSEEASLIFYLISLLIRKNEVDKVRNELVAARVKFGKNVEICKKIDILEEKLRSAGV